jgi:host factor-I protein
MSGVNLQDTFFEQAKNNNYVVMVHLVGKVRIVGTIKDYDKYSVTINSYGQDQLIYKQAISTIVLPRGRSIRLMIPRPEGAESQTNDPRSSQPRDRDQNRDREYQPRRPYDQNRGDQSFRGPRPPRPGPFNRRNDR